MTAMRRIALLVTLLVLAPAGVAQAGGWATVELGAAPAGLQTGKPWHVELIVKQHGITPMADVTPSITIENGSTSRTFPAHATSRVGVYAADVTFPSAGDWRARISDGFTDAVPHRVDGLSVSAGTASSTSTAVPHRVDGLSVSAGTASSTSTTPQVVMIAIVALLFLVGLIATVPRRERRVARGRGRATPRAVA
jgi:hypothetical protein